MAWEIFMHYAPTSSPFATHLRWGETLGWGTVVLSGLAGLKGAATLIGAITPDMVNPWLILIASTIVGAAGVWTVVYARIHRARLDGETIEAIYAANNRAIRDGKPIPFPAFLPAGAIPVTATTVVDAAPAKPPEVKPIEAAKP